MVNGEASLLDDARQQSTKQIYNWDETRGNTKGIATKIVIFESVGMLTVRELCTNNAINIYQLMNNRNFIDYLQLKLRRRVDSI